MIDSSVKSLTEDTIAAIATPTGKAGIGVIRISGGRTKKIAEKLLGYVPKPRYAVYAVFKDSANNSLDQGIALYFPAPNSFTGEDTLELQGHGGQVILDLVLQRVLQVGARLAEPGEFSKRAFLNGKIDLTQAEAIADLIDSSTEEAARSALRSLQGNFSSQIHNLVATLTQLRAYIEASLDFSEEEIDFLNAGEVNSKIEHLIEDVEKILTSANHGRILREGIKVVIVGPPNAGKSSLLNQLSGNSSAIVTNVPGTTRDTIREYLEINGVSLHIVDTAGLRKTKDEVELEGIKKTKEELIQADHILLVLDCREEIELESSGFLANLFNKLEIENLAAANTPLTVILNKIDLVNKSEEKNIYSNFTSIKLSAKNGTGIEKLKEHLLMSVGYKQTEEGTFIARRRHVDALEAAKKSLLNALTNCNTTKYAELTAEELRQAQLSLSSITGEFTADDLLGKIFSSFCIGK